MELIFLVFAALGCVSATDFEPNDWKYVQSPLEAPRYQEILNQIIPPSTQTVKRGGRIAGGVNALLGQFPHQALLLTRDTLGDDYICGGSIISHNWILTVSHTENLIRACLNTQSFRLGRTLS